MTEKVSRSHAGGGVLAILIAGIAAVAVMPPAERSTGGFGTRPVNSTTPLPPPGYVGAYSTGRVSAWDGLRDGGFGQTSGYSKPY